MPSSHCDFTKKLKFKFFIFFFSLFSSSFLIFIVKNRKKKIRFFLFSLAFIYGLGICKDIYLEIFDEKKDNSLAT
jgi:hypothetical protein